MPVVEERVRDACSQLRKGTLVKVVYPDDYDEELMGRRFDDRVTYEVDYFTLHDTVPTGPCTVYLDKAERGISSEFLLVVRAVSE